LKEKVPKTHGITPGDLQELLKKKNENKLQDQIDQAKAVFDRVDVDNDGYINKPELIAALHKIIPELKHD